jgi:hypothetical protein
MDEEFSLTTENVSGTGNQNLKVNSSSFTVMHGTAYGMPVMTPNYLEHGGPLPALIWAIGFAFVWLLYGGLCLWYGLKQMRIREEMQKNVMHEDTPEGSAIESIFIAARDTGRLDEWDWCKSICMWAVILGHTQGFFGSIGVGTPFFYHNWIFIPFSIPLFVAISGVFSERVHAKYWLSTLVGMPFAILSFNLVIRVVCLITPGIFDGKHDPLLGHSWWRLGIGSIDWYLYCLIVWRVIWPPLFCFTRRIKIPNLVTVAFSWLVTYFFLNSSLLRWLYDQGIDRYFPIMQFVYHMPTFTFGLLYSSKEWSDILNRSNRVTIAALVLFLFHHGAMMFWKDYIDFNSVSCWHLGDDYVFHGRHVSCSTGSFIPIEFVTHSITIQTLGSFLLINFIKVANFFMYLPAWGVMFRATRYLSPRLARLVAGNGSRSMYSYLLHWCLWIVPAVRTGFAARVMLWYTPHDGWNSSDLLEHCVAWPLSVVVLHIVGSELSERIFSFMVMTPLWIVEYLGILDTAAKAGKSELQPITADHVDKAPAS